MEDDMPIFHWRQPGLDFLRELTRLPRLIETQTLLQGRMLSEHVKSKESISSLSEVEFRVFSQFGDDGILQWLTYHLDIPNRTFIEFGVGDYHESNTRFLLMNDNWAGFVMDGSESNVSRIIRSDYYWKYSLIAKSVFVDRDNINKILAECPFDREIGILHIDLDGVDYWIWNEINGLRPVIVILEYNSVFGKERAITVPYDPNFSRTKAHFSNLYWGASLPALQDLSARKGYAFIGSNSAGNNAYFVRVDKLNESVEEISVEAGYVESKYRESRDRQGKLTYAIGQDRLDLLRGLPVHNVATGQMEAL
jgi:hypothetical protein